jgi:uncharacterized membrane protein YGL010W
MSRSHFLFRDLPMDAWVDRYEKSHQNPINRVFHTFGIPMIAVSIPLFLIAPLVRGFWKIPLSLFTAGWICQVLGHIIEGKPPEFLKDWRFLLVGLRWWLQGATRLVTDSSLITRRIVELPRKSP